MKFFKCPFLVLFPASRLRVRSTDSASPGLMADFGTSFGKDFIQIFRRGRRKAYMSQCVGHLFLLFAVFQIMGLARERSRISPSVPRDSIVMIWRGIRLGTAKIATGVKRPNPSILRKIDLVILSRSRSRSGIRARK